MAETVPLVLKEAGIPVTSLDPQKYEDGGFHAVLLIPALKRGEGG